MEWALASYHGLCTEIKAKITQIMGLLMMMRARDFRHAYIVRYQKNERRDDHAN